MDAVRPLVSCVMPTWQRRRFVPQAIDYFERQDWPERELLVLDDGDDCVEDLVAGRPGVRYLRLEGKRTLGEKLNLGCEMARGSIVAHWDDDDWYAPWRLSYQVRTLLRDGTDLCGINHLLYYDLDRQRGWLYRYPPDQPVWLIGSSLTYRKELWEEIRFQEIDVGMDGLFVWATDPARISVLEDHTYAVHTIHGANVSPKQTGGPWWAEHPVDAIRRVVGDDWRFYATDSGEPWRGREAVPSGQGADLSDGGREPVPTDPGGEVGGDVPESVPSGHGGGVLRTPDSRPGGEGWRRPGRPATPAPPAGPSTPPATATATASRRARATLPDAPPVRNVYACLVHEELPCVVDLVRNLRHVDPDSTILLYNGGPDPDLLDGGVPLERWGARVHPTPQPMAWGRLHGYALDCMRWALAEGDFDTLTVVDSDQLATRPGLTRRLGAFLSERPAVGLMGRSAGPQGASTRVGPAVAALQERDRWRPFLRRFPDGEALFPHWTFWPSTVLTADACREIVRLFDTDEQLQELMRATSIWATEEIVFPTLVALLGLDVVESPASYDFVRYRVAWSDAHVDAALTREDVFFLHPVPRRYGDRVRTRVRDHLGHYPVERAPGGSGTPAPEAAPPDPPSPPVPASPALLLPSRVLEEMREVRGWLSDEEGELLLEAARHVLRTLDGPHHVVEIGSYCGRATTVLGRVARAAAPGSDVRIWAVDRFDGRLGGLDTGIQAFGASLEAFRHQMRRAGLQGVVETVEAAPHEVDWDRPISLLLVDGLHDYVNVCRDVEHYRPYLRPHALVAFHDCADFFPGVRTYVDELLAEEGWVELARAGTLVVLRAPVAARAATFPAAVPEKAGP